MNKSIEVIKKVDGRRAQLMCDNISIISEFKDYCRIWDYNDGYIDVRDNFDDLKRKIFAKEKGR